MSNIYQTFNSNLPNYETPSDGPGSPGLTERDIDKEIVYPSPTTAENHNFYDYDIGAGPIVSGNQFIVPMDPDVGLHRDIPQGDPSASLSDMLDSVNNGKIADIRNLDSKLTMETEDLLIHKDNQQTSIKGLLEDSALNDVFFSDMNIDALQKSIRYNVFKYTQKVIDFQPPIWNFSSS